MKRLKQVWHFRRFAIIPPGAPRLNALAALIGAMALGILLLTFHARPAGAGLDSAALTASQLKLSTPVKAIGSGAADQNKLASLSVDEMNSRIHGAIHSSRIALQLHLTLLELGKHHLESIPDYSATFLKQERVNGEDLQELQTIELKLRHEPFSVHMQWIEGGDVGREVLYVDGQLEGRMQVRLGGKKGKLLPILKLDPSGSQAMAEARHPASEMGLLHLIDVLLKYRRRDFNLKQGVRWEMVPDQKFTDRVCDCWVVEYDNREVEPVYRKSIIYIDRELALPICVRNFGWPGEDVETTDAAALDEATLIEFYGYTDLKFENRLSDADFDKLRR
jgi:hypothetical protein